MGNTAQHCRLGLFQDSDFAGDFEDSKSTSVGVLCIFGSRTSVTISWMCKKCTQYTLSHAHFSQFSQFWWYLALYMTFSTCTHVRVAQGSRLAEDVLCKHLHINQKSFCLVMCHRPLIDVPDFSSFCSTPPPPKTTSHLLTGTRQTTSATPRGGLLFGPLALWPNTTLSQVMSPTPGSKSAVSTLRSTTPLMSTASTPRVTMPPQSQPPRTLTVFSSKRQPAVANRKNFVERKTIEI